MRAVNLLRLAGRAALWLFEMFSSGATSMAMDIRKQSAVDLGAIFFNRRFDTLNVRIKLTQSKHDFQTHMHVEFGDFGWFRLGGFDLAR